MKQSRTRAPNLPQHPFTYLEIIIYVYDKLLNGDLSFCCRLSKGQGVALLEREVQRQPRNPPGRRQQGDDRWLWQPRDLRQPGGHGRHAHILPQPQPAVHGAGTQERTYAQLESDEDYPAQPGGRGALRGR